MRVAWWTYPRYKYTLEFEFLRTYGSFDELDTLLAMLQRHMGKWDSFLITDPEDNAVSAMPFGKGTGALATFQLQRSRVASASLPAAASRAYWPAAGDGYEPIFDANSAPAIYIDGTLKTLTTHYTISATGLVTFVTAPALNSILTWTGTFYRRVRMDDEGMSHTRFVANFWESKTIKLISVKS